MKNSIELYINNRKVDLSNSTKVLFTYKQKDVYSPVAVKNSFSKTITLEGTANNNDIFNHLYSLDVSYTNGGVQNFNSSKRNPFELYHNGELIESGYMKLDSIKHTGNQVKYNITLYGGLGDFLYNLMYDAGGNKKTLASLDYGVDMTFNINAQQVDNAWKVLNPSFSSWARSTDKKALKKWEYINFMPAYNGISDTIDSEHILVNTNGYNGLMRKWNGNTNRWEDTTGFPTQLENNVYTTKNGYGLVELPKPMNEWQTRDLRSYMQRPVVSMKKVIEAIQNPENNGGYTVVLDEDFFNSTNPYYENAWLTLPLLDEIKEKDNQTELDLPHTISNTSELGERYLSSTWSYPINTTQVIPVGTTEGKFKCKLAVQQSGSSISGNKLYMAANINNTGIFQKDINKGKQYEGILITLVAFNQSEVVATSDVSYYLTSEITTGDYMSYTDAGISIDSPGVIKTQIGYFEKSGSTNTYVWPSEFEFNIDISSISIDHFSVFLHYKQKNNGKVASLTEPFYLYNQRQITSNTAGLVNYRGTFFLKDNLEHNLFDRELKVFLGGEDTGIFSNAEITQKTLLTTENTPADYLLSYTKLFNLYYDKDPFSKTVYIRTMNHFYDGEKIDLQKHIDRSKDINITPLAFDKNVYEMSYKTGDTGEMEGKYLDKYGSDFGSQKIYTGYDFDSEKKQLYDGVFKNAVQVLQSSKFYTMAHPSNDADNETPTFLYNTVTYQLFNSAGETSDVSLVRPSYVDETCLNPKSRTQSDPLVAPYYDAFNKVQFCNAEEPVDGKDCLVFFNGFKQPYVSTYEPFYTLSDDIQTMISLCDKPCYLYSQSEYNVAGQKICIRINNLPQFSRYITLDASDSIINSLDIGETKEIYVPDFKFANYNTCIYKRYWNNYIQDLYDIDTKIVECYVKFDEKVMQNNLKHYYYFDNSYWVISEIIDYNPDSSDTVKVKFVKVNNFGVYTDYDPAELPSGILALTLNPTMIGSAQTTVDVYVWIADGGSWYLDASSSAITFSQTTGVGDTHLTLTVPALSPSRRGVKERTFTIYLTKSDDSYQTSAKITQSSIYNNSVFTVEQFAQYSHSDVPQTGGTCLYTIRSTYPWTVTSDRTYCVPRTNSGTGNTEYGETLEVDWSVSDTYGTRNAWLTFTNSIGEELRINKAQAGITADQYLEYVYEQSGGSFTTSAYTSGGTVETQPYWVTVTDNGNGTYTITAEENEGSERNGTVVISAPTNEGPVKIIIQVTQTERVIPVNTFSVAPMYLGFEHSGGTGTIEITNPDNHTWSIVSYPEWVTVTSDALLVTVIASVNDTIYTKSGYLVVYDSTFDETFSVLLTSQYNPNASSFKVEPQALEFMPYSGYNYINIVNPDNHNWRIVSADTWYSFNQSQGSISTIISCFAEENTGDSRTSTAVIYDYTDNSIRNVYITQYGVGTPVITFNPNPLTVSSTGGTYTVTINYANRNGDFLVATPSNSAITVGNIVFTGDTAIVSITVPENSSFDEVNYSIVFSGYYDTKTLSIVQDAKEGYLNVDPIQIHFSSSSAGTTTITIISNDSWTIN